MQNDGNPHKNFVYFHRILSANIALMMTNIHSVHITLWKTASRAANKSL